MAGSNENLACSGCKDRPSQLAKCDNDLKRQAADVAVCRAAVQARERLATARELYLRDQWQSNQISNDLNNCQQAEVGRPSFSMP